MAILGMQNKIREIEIKKIFIFNFSPLYFS